MVFQVHIFMILGRVPSWVTGLVNAGIPSKAFAAAHARHRRCWSPPSPLNQDKYLDKGL